MTAIIGVTLSYAPELKEAHYVTAAICGGIIIAFIALSHKYNRVRTYPRIAPAVTAYNDSSPDSYIATPYGM